MKTNITRAILCLAGFVLFYTGCKKNTAKPAAAAGINYEKLSSQLATTFYKSITGQYGGTDVRKGISSPFSVKTGGYQVLNSASASPLCGFAIDTVYKYNNLSKDQDTVFSHSGNFYFKYLCDNGQVDGYWVLATVFYTADSGPYDNESDLEQSDTVRALDQTFKLVSMNGAMTATTSLSEGGQNNYLNTYFKLNGLKVNFSSGTADVTAGIANFHTVYFPDHPDNINIDPYTYDGTIQFLGNHKAKLTINTNNTTYVYLVDLITGVATPA
jgi:hypothetical protein